MADEALPLPDALLVLAGNAYGTGSSRDQAAKGTLWLGSKIVVVESIERMLTHCGDELAPGPFVQSQQQINAGLAHVEATQKLLGSLLDSLVHRGGEGR